MIEDYEMELTAAAGQAVTIDAYSSKSIDLRAALDAAVGEPLHVLAQVTEDFDELTSLLVALRGDDDGAGTNVVTLLSKSILLAGLTVAAGVQRIGIVPPGTKKRYLRGHFDVTGDEPTEGKIRMWLAKGSNVTPANPSFTI